MKTTVAERGQVTIPKALREKLGIRPGTVMSFTIQGGRLIGVKDIREDAVAGVFGCLKRPVDTDKLIAELRGEK
jgi:AbrB family looped-hinge helix DNA binding protein